MQMRKKNNNNQNIKVHENGHRNDATVYSSVCICLGNSILHNVESTNHLGAIHCIA